MSDDVRRPRGAPVATGFTFRYARCSSVSDSLVERLEVETDRLGPIGSSTVRNTFPADPAMADGESLDVLLLDLKRGLPEAEWAQFCAAVRSLGVAVDRAASPIVSP